MPNPSELERLVQEADERLRETATDELQRRSVEANGEIDLLGGKPAWFRPDDEAKALDHQIHDELDYLGRLLREANECAGRIEKLSQEIARGR